MKLLLTLLFLLAATGRSTGVPLPTVSQGSEKGSLVVRTATGEQGLVFAPSGRTPELTFLAIAQAPNATFPWVGFVASFPEYRAGLLPKKMQTVGMVHVYSGELRILWYEEATTYTLGALSWARRGTDYDLLVDVVRNGVGEARRFSTITSVAVDHSQCLSAYTLQQAGLAKILALWRQYRVTPPDKRQALLDRLCRPTLCAEMRQRYETHLARAEPFRHEWLSITSGPTWRSVTLTGRFAGERQRQSIRLDLDHGWLDMPYRTEDEWATHFQAGHSDDENMIYNRKPLEERRGGGR